MKWKGVIFDRDGTIFESLPLILRSFNFAIEPFTERRPTPEEWFAAFGPPETEVLGAFIPAEKKQEAFDRFYSYYSEHIEEIAVFDGIPGLLARLKDNGVKVMLFTGGGRISTRFCLEKANILSYFHEMVTGDDVIRPKPDPEGILTLLSACGLRGLECLVVGDAPADIQAGHAAGAVTGLARWSLYPQNGLMTVQPDFVFHSVQDFAEFLSDS